MKRSIWVLLTAVTVAAFCLPAGARPKAGGAAAPQPQLQPAGAGWTPGPDWPTEMHDEGGSGVSGQTLAFPLAAQWTYRAAAPAPSWPESAKFDYFHGNKPVKPVVVYDHAYHVVGADGRVYFASSADDKVYCLSLATGQVLWSFQAEGPVRLAPTLAGGKVLFGSDDGAVYALSAAGGKRIWKTRPTQTDTRIAGNGRIISLHPVRTSVLAAGGVVHFCAGLFPEQGVYYVTADLATGKVASVAALPRTAQGYLRASGGQIHVGGGMDPKTQSFAAALPASAAAPAPLPPRPGYPYALIVAAGVQIGGGDNAVAAFGPQGAPLWTGKVDGRAMSLAIVGDRLLVGTDKGTIHCFGPGAGKDVVVQAPAPAAGGDANARAQARAILAAAGVQRGYALLCQAAPGLAAAMAEASAMKVVCLEPGAAAAANLRAKLDARGLPAGRVSVIESAGATLPFGDYLFNVVVAPPGAGVSRGELLRVTRPCGGVLLAADGKVIERRGPVGGAGEWSHAYADAGNSACSGDTLTAGEMALQWFGEPGPQKMVDRHNRTTPPLCVNGRLFVSGLDYVYAVDAYNGTVLWEKAVPDSHRLGMPRSSGGMVAAGDWLFVASGKAALKFDADSGRQLAALPVPAADREWGVIYHAAGKLVGSGNRAGAARWPIGPSSWQPGYSTNQPLIVSDCLFAFDAATGARLWTYQARSGAIPNPAVALADGCVYFLESANAATREAASGRATVADLVAGGVELVALDLADGKVKWRKTIPEPGWLSQTLWLQHARGTLVVSGSGLVAGGKRGQSIRYLLAAYDAADGKGLWNLQHTSSGAGSVSGAHGELTQHPAIVVDHIYIPPRRYELRTGKPAPSAAWYSSCGPISTSAVAMFYRGGNPIIHEFAGSPPRPLTPVTRPGCWINIIPAAGLVLVPEASSGCTCQAFSIQTSLAMRPRKPAPVPAAVPAK